jgi:hypothetical protein
MIEVERLADKILDTCLTDAPRPLVIKQKSKKKKGIVE